MTNLPTSSTPSAGDTIGSQLPDAPLQLSATAAATSAPDQPVPVAPKPPGPDEVDLDEPIIRGSQTITRIHLRRPRSGELRGVQLTQLLSMDVNSLHTVLPRITSPLITKPEAENLDPADLVQLGEKVIGFLLKKADRLQFQSE